MPKEDAEYIGLEEDPSWNRQHAYASAWLYSSKLEFEVEEVNGVNKFLSIEVNYVIEQIVENAPSIDKERAQNKGVHQEDVGMGRGAERGKHAIYNKRGMNINIETRGGVYPEQGGVTLSNMRFMSFENEHIVIALDEKFNSVYVESVDAQEEDSNLNELSTQNKETDGIVEEDEDIDWGKKKLSH
ncbi:hypothetical protein KI387_015847 [Taxus chinensis]|uniref:Uncharacterized protein n=1 Tax=Taxus chinensis TaxID=29808 RepID=A0AA38GGQ1_TAXCH|nr:hypothetical protein KI387_015847 [Taxus chinensis]